MIWQNVENIFVCTARRKSHRGTVFFRYFFDTGRSPAAEMNGQEPYRPASRGRESRPSSLDPRRPSARTRGRPTDVRPQSIFIPSAACSPRGLLSFLTRSLRPAPSRPVLSALRSRPPSLSEASHGFISHRGVYEFVLVLFGCKRTSSDRDIRTFCRQESYLESLLY